MASAGIDYYIRKGDVLPALEVAPETQVGTDIVPSGTISVTITNPDTGASLTPAGTPSFFTDTDNVVKLKYAWGASETTDMGAGLYRFVFKTLYGGTDGESTPNNTEILVQVYDAPPGQILTSKADYDSVISILGVTLNDFSYDDVESIAFLQAAEAKITDVLSAQAGYGTTVPSVTQIMSQTGTATTLDKTHLKAATVYEIAYLFGPGETNSVDVSQQVGNVSRDLGGIGETWRFQMTEFERQVDYHLGKITGFKRWRTL